MSFVIFASFWTFLPRHHFFWRTASPLLFVLLLLLSNMCLPWTPTSFWSKEWWSHWNGALCLVRGITVGQMGVVGPCDVIPLRIRSELNGGEPRWVWCVRVCVCGVYVVGWQRNDRLWHDEITDTLHANCQCGKTNEKKKTTLWNDERKKNPPEWPQLKWCRLFFSEGRGNLSDVEQLNSPPPLRS